MLDHGAFRSQITLQDSDRSAGSDWFVKRTDNIFFSQDKAVFLIGFIQPVLTLFVETVLLQFFQIFPLCFSGYGHYI